jgi:hypothetical protein
MVALKVAAASIGTAGAGLAAQIGGRTALVGGGVLALVVIGGLALDRMRHPAAADQEARVDSRCRPSA